MPYQRQDPVRQQVEFFPHLKQKQGHTRAPIMNNIEEYLEAVFPGQNLDYLIPAELGHLITVLIWLAAELSLEPRPLGRRQLLIQGKGRGKLPLSPSCKGDADLSPSRPYGPSMERIIPSISSYSPIWI